MAGPGYPRAGHSFSEPAYACLTTSFLICGIPWGVRRLAGCPSLPSPRLVQVPPAQQFPARATSVRLLAVLSCVPFRSLWRWCRPRCWRISLLSGHRSQPFAQQQAAPQVPQQPQPPERMAQQEARRRRPAEQWRRKSPRATGAAAGPARAATPAASARMPTDDVLLMLIRSSLIALNQANVTGNYTVFRELSAPGFQQANSAARLAEVFANCGASNLTCRRPCCIQPKLFSRPEMSTNGMLRVTGFFPRAPERVNFDFIFQPVRGQWRLFGIPVNTSRAQPAAPQPQTAPAPAPAPEAAKPPRRRRRRRSLRRRRKRWRSRRCGKAGRASRRRHQGSDGQSPAAPPPPARSQSRRAS